MISRLVSFLFFISLLSGCATVEPERKSAKRKLPPGQYEVFGEVYEILPTSFGYLEIGVASWYGKKFHGRLTAMGETYDMFEMSAAHKTLPLPTVVKVTNLDNARSIKLRVNDRGPFHDDRLIDLSYAAAKALGFESKGIAPVVVEALDEINHPELVAQTRGESYYLQVGAFQHRFGAEKRMTEVGSILPGSVGARILQSETNSGVIYKVWVGPMKSRTEEEQIASIISRNNFGNPLRVKVD